MKQIVKLTPFKDFAIHVSYVQRSLLAIVLSIETANLQYYKYPTFACISDYKKKQIFSATANTAAYSSKKEERKTKVKLRDDDKFQESILSTCNTCFALKCFTRYATAINEDESINTN